MTGPSSPADYLTAMAGLRATLEKRLAERDDAAAPARATVWFDWKGLGRALRGPLAASGQSQKRLAAEIGVTTTALSKLASGGNVSIESVIAICRHAGVDYEQFCRMPVKTGTCTLLDVKHASRRAPAAAPSAPEPVLGLATGQTRGAGRATTRGGRSTARPAAGRKGKS